MRFIPIEDWMEKVRKGLEVKRSYYTGQFSLFLDIPNVSFKTFEKRVQLFTLCILSYPPSNNQLTIKDARVAIQFWWNLVPLKTSFGAPEACVPLHSIKHNSTHLHNSFYQFGKSGDPRPLISPVFVVDSGSHEWKFGMNYLESPDTFLAPEECKFPSLLCSIAIL